MTVDLPLRRSYWGPDPAAELAPPLQGDIEADLTVVGGGVIGVSTAIAAHDAGLDVVLLERAFVGHGASGRAAGMLTLPVTWGEAAAPWLADDAMAKSILRWSQDAIDAAERFLGANGVACGLLRRPLWLIAHDQAGYEDLIRASSLLRGAGIAAEPLRDSWPTTYRSFGALRLGNQAVVDPWNMARGLRAAALRRGVRLFEGTAVDDVTGGEPVTVRAPGGTVRSKYAVLAVNGFSGALSRRDDLLVPCRVYAAATAPLPPAARQAIGPADDVILNDFRGRSGGPRLFERFRQSGELIFGASTLWPPKDLDQDWDARSFRFLLRELQRRYPGLGDPPIATIWSGLECFTRSGLPILDWLPNLENVAIGVIGNGRGLGLGTTCGRLLVSRLLDKPMNDKASDLFLSLCSLASAAGPVGTNSI